MEADDILQHPHVAVVILTWNGKSWLEKFLPTVLQSNWPSLEIVVADNNSTDDTVAYLKENFPKVTIIETKSNLGFAGGYNAALKQVTADYYILLNHDVEVTNEWIAPLIHAMELDADIGATMPKLRAYNQREQFEHAGASGGYLDALGYPFCRGRIFEVTEKDEGQYDDQHEVFWASGAALCIRAELFRRLKGFDQDYFAHMEEIDLCWRLKRVGYKIVVVPESVVYHVGGSVLKKEDPKKIYLNFRNSLSMMFKNLDFFELIWKLPLRLLVLDIVALMKSVVQGKWKEARAIIVADFHFFISWPKQILKRRQTRKQINRHQVGVSRVKKQGYYKGSIVWQHFVLKKNRFSDLRKRPD